jgi:glyoxylase-like metal-dependent hydrolase (beta-lactamase superfamily II)
MSDYLYQFRTGRMKMTVIGEGILKIPAAKIYGGRPESEWRLLLSEQEGWIDYGMNVLLCGSSDRVVLVDTGVGENHPTRDAFEKAFPFVERTRLLTALEELAITPKDVTDVIITHAHGDHFMGCTVERGGARVPAFPAARYLMLKQEWNPEGRDPASTYMLHFPVLKSAGVLKLVEGRFEVAPGITIVPAPGESPGHAMVRFGSEGEVAYFLGDLFHDVAEVAHQDWVWSGRDVEKMIASRRALADAAMREKAVLVAAHIPFPGTGRIVQTAEGQRWEPLA